MRAIRQEMDFGKGFCLRLPIISKHMGKNRLPLLVQCLDSQGDNVAARIRLDGGLPCHRLSILSPMHASVAQVWFEHLEVFIQRRFVSGIERQICASYPEGED